MGNCLTGSEAIFGFCAWLFAREEQIIISSNDEVPPIIGLIKTFCNENKLPEPREDYLDYLTMPPTEQAEQENPDRHQQRHILLHRYLDELIADYIHTTGNLPFKISLMELMEWSAQQIISLTTESNYGKLF